MRMNKQAKPLDRAKQRGKVGKKVRAARKARSWTQETFASEVDVSISWLAQLERGEERWPGKQVRYFRAEAGKLLRIAEALHPLVNAAELLEAWDHDPELAAGVAEWISTTRDGSSNTVDDPETRANYRVSVRVTRCRELERLYGISPRTAEMADEIIQVFIRWEE